ncbi:MAG: cobyric acid synthase, partial [Pseudomonadota bacterium]|nr:cobyric acid synthase [Pseudomonadota bacterium]
HLLGTLACLSDSERARVIGFVINRFRGDIALLEPGLRWLEAQTGKPVLAVLPFLKGLFLDAEDAVQSTQNASGTFRVIVPALPRMSNHTDMDALRAHPALDLQFIAAGQPIPPADLIILPGSKNTRGDLAWLLEQGWRGALQRHLRYGGRVIGLCGGFQMLGRSVADARGVEGPSGTSEALGLLDMTTELTATKRLAEVHGRCTFADAPVRGYEIHMGRSDGPALRRPAFLIEGQPEGARSDDDQVLGTYLHGVFDTPAACAALLAWAGYGGTDTVDLNALREVSLERIADAAEPLYLRLSQMTPFR